MEMPITIDDRDLSEAQYNVLRSIFFKLVLEAKHEEDTAKKLSITVFRKLYEPAGEKAWKARRVVELGSAGCKIIGSKFWRSEMNMISESRV